jgi:hypothetical protein
LPCGTSLESSLHVWSSLRRQLLHVTAGGGRSAGKIETDLGRDVVEPSSPVAALEVRVAGFRVPPEVIVATFGWYLRFSLSYRDVDELLVERGIEVDHVAI